MRFPAPIPAWQTTLPDQPNQVLKSIGCNSRRPRQTLFRNGFPRHQITIMDGRTTTFYSPEKLQYIQTVFQKNHEPTEIHALQRLASLPVIDAAFLADEVVAIQGQAYPCQVIRARYRWKPGAPLVTAEVSIATGYLDSSSTSMALTQA